MADTYLRQSPLAHLHLEARAGNETADGDAGVSMGERQLLGMINLRGQMSDPAFGPAIKKALGVAPPDAVNEVSGKPDGVHILALGPDEWLAVTPRGRENELHAKLTKALAGLHAAAPTGEARTVIRISGPHARDALAKGCPLDLHPRAFGPGRCAQTVLARAGMTVHQTGEDAYDIIVLRSFAEYVWTWLEDAAREYGVRVVAGPP